MADHLNKSFAYRSLLTDTLPYEVPVIFSNDRFHASLSAPPVGPLEPIMAKLLEQGGRYTVPYNYTIAKDNKRKRTLSIVHPLAQRAMSEFYELHSGGMLSHCARGRFSLRKPVALASPFTKEVVGEHDRAKSGIPQLLAEAGEADMSHMTSYFAYGKYNLLGKFIASREYIRLEIRYAMMRQIDISKCFYNIYTHSVTWAVKSKEFGKDQRDTYSFEGAFDKLMQKCNYNETNGIVVGPEFSRIFAEIIFQDIDERVESELNSSGLRSGLEYDIRRYVDDYFVFSSNEIILDRVESCLRTHLERYKLYVNEKKVTTHLRPFVSALTLARDEVAAKLSEVSSSLAEMKPGVEIAELNRKSKALRSRLSTIRLAVARHDVQFANISGWLMSRLKRLIRRAIKAIPEHTDTAAKEPLGDVAVSALETALYICSIDLRVRTTYSLCQIALLFEQSQEIFSSEQNDLISHLISDHVSGLIRYRMITQGDDFGMSDDIELCNLLICGAHFVGTDFLTSAVIEESFERILASQRITYFMYITLAFCMRKAPDLYGEKLGAIHAMARARVLAPRVSIDRDTEEYLLAVDYMTSPEVTPSDKQSFFQSLFGQKNPVSFSTLGKIGDHFGFADWSGVTVEHQLRKKELRPVYAWG